ncbi:hypothetical protein AAG570_011271 [Ranatra chinensis]|uniref:Uncharacterized protein n=1 Tax=Ranatra chinensis TaxID=642074 RepID=A0ABD0YK53_9HEMI
MASKRRNMFQKNKTQETTENELRKTIKGTCGRGGWTFVKSPAMRANQVLLLWAALLSLCWASESQLESQGPSKRGLKGDGSGNVYRIWPIDARGVEQLPLPENKAKDMDYPVKLTRKFLDSEGNVRMVTIYGNRNDPALPIFDERIATGRILNVTEDIAPRPQGFRRVAFPGRRAGKAERTASSEPKSVQDIIASRPQPLEAAGSSLWNDEPEEYEVIPDYEKGGEGYAEGGGGRGGEVYQKGRHQEHGHEDNAGVAKSTTGEKKGHLKETNSYTDGQQASLGDKGTKSHRSKGHKKGKKTTGFHSVHHKDEYKKDEVFYDEDSSVDEEQGHELGHYAYKGEDGVSGKYGHLDSGYASATEGYKSDKEKGVAYEAVKGHADHAHNHHHKGYKDGTSYRNGNGYYGK